MSSSYIALTVFSHRRTVSNLVFSYACALHRRSTPWPNILFRSSGYFVQLSPKIKCAYDGTYLLFVRQKDLTRDVPINPSNVIPGQQLVPSNRSSSILPTSGRNSLRRPSTGLPPTTGSAAGSSRANALSILPAVEYDSDDSQVKKKIKVASIDWQGQTYYITGKESVIVILRDTSSV